MPRTPLHKFRLNLKQSIAQIKPAICFVSFHLKKEAENDF